ncbi:hypothetical protein HK102_007989 [Quaeritorhiza haematococci]|nr:hypothetical protein HK102_007989 [Quaeritorhiza haematococci]
MSTENTVDATGPAPAAGPAAGPPAVSAPYPQPTPLVPVPSTHPESHPQTQLIPATHLILASSTPGPVLMDSSRSNILAVQPGPVPGPSNSNSSFVQSGPIALRTCAGATQEWSYEKLRQEIGKKRKLAPIVPLPPNNQRQKRPRKRANHDIPDRYTRLRDERQPEILRRLGLRFSTEKVCPTGTQVLEKGSIDAYAKNFKVLRHFFALTGDYESDLILHEFAPENPPAVYAKTVPKVIRWKTGPKERIWRNPRTSTLVQNTYRQVVQDALQNGYTREGSTPLTPFELRRIRQYLVSHNALFEYQLWVMTLLCIRMGLRDDEMESLAVESIDWSISKARESGEVVQIAFAVQGKDDKPSVTLLVRADPETPEFCPVRHLLTWMHLSGIKTGYLFPTQNALRDLVRTGGSHVDKPMSYAAFHGHFLYFTHLIVTRPGNFGTQTCLKTFYLLGIWGGAQVELLMGDARHKTLANALFYVQDAKILKELADADPSNADKYAVSPHRAIHVVDLHAARSIVDGRSYHLHEVADNFVENLCRKFRAHPTIAVSPPFSKQTVNGFLNSRSNSNKCQNRQQQHAIPTEQQQHQQEHEPRTRSF